MTTNSLLASCLASAAVDKDATPLWSATVQTRSADLDNVWRVVDEHAESVLHTSKSALTLFHQHRQLVVKHLPRDVTEHDIRELLQGRGLKVGVVSLSVGGPGPNWARAQVQDVGPDFWEEWPGQQQHQTHPSQPKSAGSGTIRGHRVTIVPSQTENLLCVARLPRDLQNDEFKRLVSHYGDVRYCFLLCSDKTGESKGYGFVEYASREAGQRARSQLDGLLYEGHLIACDWLDASTVTFAALHSKLLYVDCLPPGFRDMGQFRKLFSAVANPPYCQIALKGGAPQDWGLVEFSQSKEAEETFLALDGRLFNGAHIRVAFFIPGVRAINIYMKLINDTCQNKGKAALLPEPPTDTVFHQLQNLTKQNPAFVQSLQNIIVTQIQTLNNPPSSGASSSASNGSSSSSGSGSGIRNGVQCHNNRTRTTNQTGSNSQTSAQLAANAQAALSMLLAAQQQAGASGGSASSPQPVPPPVHSIPPPPPVRAPLAGSYRPQFNPHTSMMEAPPLNVSVPPPPLYRAPPPPVTRPSAPSGAESTCDLQKTLSMLLGTLSSAVQSLSPTPPPPPAHPPAQAAAGALIGLLLQLLQSGSNPAPAQQPQSTLSPLSLNTAESYPHGQPERNGLLTTAPPGGQYFNHFQVAPPPLGSPGRTSWQSRESTAPASPAGSSASSHVTSWTNVLGQVRQMSSGPSSLGSTGSRGSSPTSSSSPSTSPGRQQHPPPPAPPPPPPPASGGVPAFATPVGTKRKYNHVLPSPEPSPEHGYIGQHSQGLGGHYADSYFNKRKKRN